MIPNLFRLNHPEYLIYNGDWLKYRLTYEGGSAFINQYLTKFSSKESDEELKNRKSIAYPPSFAKAAINEIKNSIYQRFDDIKRINGTSSYKSAVAGENGGVDLQGNTMNSFVGCKILPELMVLGKVGVYIDMPPLQGPTLADNQGIRPYLYYYRAEDIMNWLYDRYNNFQSVLLREWTYKYNKETGLPEGTDNQFRHIYRKDKDIFVEFYGSNGDSLLEPVKLNIKRFPFVLFNLSHSLMTDIADYQIALLNLASSDISFVMQANFPFYIEQYNPQAEWANAIKQNVTGADGTQTNSEKSGPQISEIGVLTGRRYPSNTDAPSFIHPSTEPLKASMEKQAQLKEEIRLLLNLSISNLAPKRSSAESKAKDERPLENGLSYIGLELEHGERLIAEIWSEYEGAKEVPSIHYPTNYSLKTEEEARAEAKDLNELSHILPSLTYQKELGKRISTVLLGSKISQDTLNRIHGEIDAAKTMNSDPEVIKTDIENGLVGNELASEMRGYPKGEVEKAKQDHAERLYRISLYQSKGGTDNADARGMKDESSDPKGAKQEKEESRDTTQDDIPTDKTRGEGK